jgi:hypothetical protein
MLINTTGHQLDATSRGSYTIVIRLSPIHLTSTCDCDSARDRLLHGPPQTPASPPLHLGQPRPGSSRPLPGLAYTYHSVLLREKTRRVAEVFPGCHCSPAPSEPSTRLMCEICYSDSFSLTAASKMRVAKKKTYENAHRKRQAFLQEEEC